MIVIHFLKVQNEPLWNYCMLKLEIWQVFKFLHTKSSHARAVCFGYRDQCLAHLIVNLNNMFILGIYSRKILKCIQPYGAFKISNRQSEAGKF